MLPFFCWLIVGIHLNIHLYLLMHFMGLTLDVSF